MSLTAVLKRRLVGTGRIAPERLDLLQQMPKNSVCAEIGVFKGTFSQAIIDVVQPLRHHLIDPWAFQENYAESWFGGDLGGSQAIMDKVHKGVLRRFREQIRRGEVVVNRGYSMEMAAQFPDAYFDWIYIDGNHTYEGVMGDLNSYYPKIKPGGFITGDNYGDRPDWWWKDGVKRAVDEFAASGQCTLKSISNDQFIMIKRSS